MKTPAIRTYKIPIDVFVRATDKSKALAELQSEMDYVCALDNQLLAVQYPPLKEIKVDP
jgi:hypothetical protein